MNFSNYKFILVIRASYLSSEDLIFYLLIFIFFSKSITQK